MPNDGSLIFDTKIDNSGLNHDLKELFSKLETTKNALKKQRGTVTALTADYEELGRMIRHASDPITVLKLEEELNSVAAELKTATDTVGELETQQRLLKTEIQETGKEFKNTINTMQHGLSALGKMFSRTLKRFVAFQLIYKSFAFLRDGIGQTIPEIAEIKTAFQNLAIAVINVVSPIVRVFTPALKGLANIFTNIANSIYNAIAGLFKLFGGEMPEYITSLPEVMGKTAKATKKAAKTFAAFDTIIQIGSNNTVSEAGEAVNALGSVGNAAKKSEEEVTGFTQKVLDFLKELAAISFTGLIFGEKGAGFLSFISGIANLYNSYKDMFENGINWNNLTTNMIASAKTMAGAAVLLKAFGLSSAKTITTIGLFAIVNGIGMMYTAYKDIFKNGVNWKNLTMGLAGFSLALTGALAIQTVAELKAAGNTPTIWKVLSSGLAKAAPFILIAAGIGLLYMSYKDALENGVNWKNLALGLVAFGLALTGALAIQTVAEFKAVGKTPTIWKVLSSGLAKAAPFILIAAGIGLLYMSYKDALENGVNWKNLTLGLVAAGGAINGVILVGKWTGSGKALAAAGESGSIWKVLGAGLMKVIPILGIFAGICQLYKSFKDIIDNGINWENITNGLVAAGVAVASAGVLFGGWGAIIALGIIIIGLAIWYCYEKWDEIVAKLQEIWEKFVEWLKKLWTGLVETFGEIWDGIVEFFKHPFKTIAKWFKEWWENSLIKKVFDFIKGGPDKFKKNMAKIGEPDLNVQARTASFSDLTDAYNMPDQIARAGLTSEIPQFRSSPVVTGSFASPGSVSYYNTSSNTNNSYGNINYNMLVSAFKQALYESGVGGSQQAILEVDGQRFGELVYNYGKRERARIGTDFLIKE